MNIQHKTAPDISHEMQALIGFVAESANRVLPEEVALKGKLHFLDTIASMVSGTTLKPGRISLAYAEKQAGLGAASVVGTPIRVPCTMAAFTNGMLAHADETDDSHADSSTHPGCAVIPAALAFAECYDRSGLNLLNAVVTGYEIGARVNRALDPDALRARGFGPHSIGGHWGAGAASGSLCGFNETQLRFMFSYVGQQTAGINCWMRDQEHVLKAFVFGGMPSRNGAIAAELVANGFTGIEDVFTGKGGFFYAFADNPRPEIISDNLGRDFAILTTAIKKWTVGSPIQGALDSLLAIMTEHRIGSTDVARLRVRIPDFAARVVDNREIPDINMQHCLALMLVDGTVTFASSHDESRMQDPEIVEMRSRMEIVPDAALTAAQPARQAIIEIETMDGRSLVHRTYSVRGTPGDPMTVEEVVAKAIELMEPVVGSENARGLTDAILSIENLDRAVTLRRYWS